MPTQHTGSPGLIRHRRLAFCAAGALAIAQWCAQLVLAGGDPVTILGVGGQLTAVVAAFWCATGLTPAGGGESRRLAGYVASLVAVFGTNMVAGVVGWIWLPPCRLGAGVGADTGSLVVRVIQAALSLCLAVLFLPAAEPGPRGDRVGRVPASWIVVAVACAVHASAGLASDGVASLEPWCKAITGAGAAPQYKFLLDLIAGPQEEIVFTGVALLLLARCSWRPRCAAIAANAAARGSLHLYYADHRTVWAWMLWAAVWSGGGLLLAFTVAKIVDRLNMGPRFFTITYTTGVVVAHSLTDITHMPFLAPCIVAGMALMTAGLGVWWRALRPRMSTIRRPLRCRADTTPLTDPARAGDPFERESAAD